jgi:PPOX class probable F420-dependent enzyme
VTAVEHVFGCGLPPPVEGSHTITLLPMADHWTEDARTLLEAPSPAVLTTYRRDGSALVTPVWFRWADGAFEVVIAEGDVKLQHLARDERCALLVFETVPPFRGVEVRGVPELVEGDVTGAREAIAGRYLGVDAGKHFAAERRSRRGVLLRLRADDPRVWNLSAILPG